MSFMRTLATVAVGFAAAKGVEKYKSMGGMAGLQKMMDGMGGAGAAPGAMPGMDAMSKMADQMGLGSMMQAMTGGAGTGTNPMDQMMQAFSGPQAAGAAGLGGLMAAMQGAAEAGGKGLDDMMSAFAGQSPATQVMENNAKLMISAMIQAAKADGEIDAEEQQKLMDQLGDVDAEERAFVEAELAKPLDIPGLAQQTSDAMKAQVYATSLMAIRVDSEAEATYLRQLAHALGLTEEARQRMHQAMGVA
ncbi:MAG: DUF533 domain-containing protein [Pseudomonadota bacterium]